VFIKIEADAKLVTMTLVTIGRLDFARVAP
jgi:hypothetical protein